MIRILACDCGHSEGVARKIIEMSGKGDFSDYKFYKGKDNCRTTLSALKRKGYSDELLDFYINNMSSFVIFVATWKGMPEMRWIDVNDNGTISRIQAVELIKAFADDEE